MPKGTADAKAKSLLKVATPPLSKDQIKPVVAALDAAKLANEGALSPALAREVWDTAATALCWPTSDKARAQLAWLDA